MRCMMYTLAIVVMVAAAANTFADNCGSHAAEKATAQKSCCGTDGKCCAKATCGTKAACGAKSACAGKSACTTTCKVTAGMPVMAYSVGDKSTSCPAEAKGLAAGHEGKMKYVVGEKSYDSESEAKAAYAKHLKGYLTKMTAVQYVVGDDATCCPNSAQALAKKASKPIRYRVAMVDFDSAEKAEKAAKAAAAAADKVSLTTMVDGKQYKCEKSAAAACQLSGKKSMEYCVGDMRTECRKTAEVSLLQAKIISAAEAVAKMQG